MGDDKLFMIADGEPIFLGVTVGPVQFMPTEPSKDREPITIPTEMSVEMSFAIPDDSPLYRWPPVLAANAPNN